MAKIRAYEQQTTTPDPSRAPSPYARPLQVVNPLNLESWERATRMAATAVERSNEEQARAWSSDATANARLKWTQELSDRQAKAEPGAPDFVPNYIKDFDDYANETLKSAPTEHARKFLQNRLMAIRDDLGERAIGFEAKARADYRIDKFTASTDTLAKLMNADPGQYESALAEHGALIDSADIPPMQKSALKQAATDKISSAAVWSQIQKSPRQFLSSIGFYSADEKTRKSSGDLKGQTGNAAFDALPFEKRVTMFDQAIRANAQIEADVERLGKAERERLSQDAMKNLYQLNADKQLKRWHIEQQRPLLSANEYHSALKMLEQPEGGVQSDPNAYRDLVQLISNNDFSAAEAKAFTYHKNLQLSNAHLEQIVTQARTQGRQEGPKTEYERSMRYISDSLAPSPMSSDPIPKMRLAESRDAFERWYLAGPEPGKKWTDKEVEARSKEIVAQYRMINYGETALALPLPRTPGISRSASREQLQKQVATVAATIKKRLENGEITQQVYADEMRLLNSWRKLAEGR